MSSSASLPLHPAARVMVDLIGLLGVAGEHAARHAARATFRSIDRRRGHRRLTGPPKTATASPTPMWDSLAAELKTALQVHGAKARLARHLGVPRQRVTDFVQGRRRLPDGELTLRLLHWLAETRAGRDPSFLVPPDPERFPTENVTQ
ncbi:MAG: hypothetical protein H7067_02790 [Burkholderiales bacterium]|nr:hypothetical protein [Opitutaceae bacterium]